MFLTSNIEGAWREGGKGLQIWDCFAMRHPENIVDGANACVTVDFYHRMKEDVQLMKKMGVKYFRFSISWSRILPGGKVSMGKSLEGINFYNKLIDELIANDIKPFVTLFHWDLPNSLEEEYMGFLSSKIVEDFANYAEICFWEFGDRVKNWVTLNEPYRFTYAGYVTGSSAPGRGGKNQEGETETEPYTVAYNLLNCHAAAYRKYQEDFKDNPEDVKAVEYAYDFMFGWHFRKAVVMGYFVWSFTDSYEWGSGYTIRFGMNYIDYNNNLLRYPKKSAIWFKKFLGDNKVTGSHKRSATEVEEQGEANGAPIKTVEAVQKLKKAKA
ncbi:hypothetical protein QVD17_27596 [Tagetes erecta]|uniref:Uncharacterized protein n=1 Tax=Tagetes erecta TaxID=13708 RepID=A0AAD8KC81_TARER|nr:hypothetical protein QVD17_27596 [Tagetes erecta]